MAEAPTLSLPNENLKLAVAAALGERQRGEEKEGEKKRVKMAAERESPLHAAAFLKKTRQFGQRWFVLVRRGCRGRGAAEKGERRGRGGGIQGGGG